ncbi:MAG TPA: XdhC family protein [Euzebyales bacterium]|nr:XdhC family protein [Euzebyales bacterium]
MRLEVAQRSAALIAAGVAHVRATVVRAEHPTSVHAGDAAVVHADGRIEGFVGGTCAESSVQVHARAALSSGEPLLLRILPGVEATTTEHGAVTVSNPCLSGGAVEIFLEPLAPPARLLVVGDTPIAAALATFAEPLGFAVEAVAGGEVEPRPDDAGLIVASHGRGEEAALAAALRAGVHYVALVASRRRGTAVLESLDVDAVDRDRVSVPAGMDIGARTAPEIALSILAELISLRRQPSVEVAEGVVPGDAAPEPGTAVDPVCGMTVLMSDTTISADVDGQTYWFCCGACRDTFVADRAS